MFHVEHFSLFTEGASPIPQMLSERRLAVRTKLHVGQAREYALANNVRAVVYPSACFAGTSPKGRLVRLASLGSCRLSAAAAKRSQRLRRLDICGGAANVIRSSQRCCFQKCVQFIYCVRRPCAYGVGTLSQALLGLCPRPRKPFLRKRA